MHDACSTCHDADGGRISLAAGKTFAVGGDCTTCHVEPFGTIHPPDTDHSAIVTTDGTQCGTCHTGTPLVDLDVDDPKVHDFCSTCHDVEGTLISLAGGKSKPGNCNTCHGADFTTIHPDTVDHSSAIQLSFDCAACHEAASWHVLPSNCVNCHATFNPADTSPPVTISDAQALYVIPALIKFSITDNGGKVGVGTTYHRLDGETAQVGSSVLVTSTGTHTLEFWSVDQAGNVESPTNNVNFEILGDTTPPVTTSNAQATYETGADIMLTATDDNSVEITTYYKINNGPLQTGTNVFVGELNGNYDYTLEFWSVDWSGNEEAHHTANFTIYGGTGTLSLVWGDSDTSTLP